MDTFVSCMREGATLRERGRFDEAIKAYQDAKMWAGVMANRAEALSQIGVTYRLMGLLDEASNAFEEALDYLGRADRSATYGRLMRDFGMLALDRAAYENDASYFKAAKRRFGQSISAYDRLNDSTERAISQGFMGRAYFIEGNRDEAVRIMLAAHQILKCSGDLSGERDNLVWLARASARYRWRYALRGLRVTLKTRRLNEYVVLLIGGDSLYCRLAARR
jgi:tetratricopeptide (TPR) repeat protein